MSTEKRMNVNNNGENKSAFAELVAKFDTIANTARDTDEFTDTLQALAYAITCSVLKRCSGVGVAKKKITATKQRGENKAMKQLRYDVVHDKHISDAIKYANLLPYERITKYNKDGEVSETVVYHIDYDHIIMKNVCDGYGDGIDLMHDAIVSLLQSVSDADADGLPIDLERRYVVRKINKRVYAVVGEEPVFVDVETSPIVDAFKAVRSAVQKSRALQSIDMYTYIDDLKYDDEKGDYEVIYRRCFKYADVGNNSGFGYTADKAVFEKVERVITALGLTGRQYERLLFRMRGYGYDVLARCHGVSKNAVVKSMKQIQEKALSMGITPYNIPCNLLDVRDEATVIIPISDDE